MKKALVLSLISLAFGTASAQTSCYWQQHVDYKMEVDMNVKNYHYTGKQELVYTNNSPDTLRKVYYHLFNNAFQPGAKWMRACKASKILTTGWLLKRKLTAKMLE